MTMLDGHVDEATATPEWPVVEREGFIDPADVVFREEWYPREKPSTRTIERYADALRGGVILPPIALDVVGNVLLDGYHRWKAHIEIGSLAIPAQWIVLHDIPRILYAASQNVGHGDRVKSKEEEDIACGGR